MRIIDRAKIEGYVGLWYSIDSEFINGEEYFLLESEEFGDDIPCIIVDSNLKVVLDDVCNGLWEYKEYLGLIQEGESLSLRCYTYEV